MVQLFVASLLVLLSIPFMLKAERLKPRLSELQPIFPYSYSQLRLSSPGFRSPVADFLFMNICYLTGSDVFKGGKERRINSREWNLLIENVGVIERLDPYYFDPLYYLGAYDPWKLNGNRELLLKVNSILLRGSCYIDDWRIPFLMGFNYFYFLNDKVKGAEYLKRAARMEGAPLYLKLLVPRLYAESGKIDLAIAATYEELKHARKDLERKSLEKRLKALTFLKELNEAVKLYRERFGRCPSDLRQLVKARILKEIPKDPYGGKFYIVKKTCSVWTTSDLRPVKSTSSSR